MTKYAIRTASGYVAGIFPSKVGVVSYTITNSPDFALTWPSMTEAGLEIAMQNINGTIEAVER